MRRTQKEEIIEAFSLSNEPIEQRTILFIEEKNHSNRGNCNVLFNILQNSDYFKDWKYKWASDGDIFDDISELTEESVREYLLLGSIGYRRALETSSVLVTSELLPIHYIKRPEQFIIGVFRRGLVDVKANKLRLRTQLSHTLNAVDVLIIEDQQDEEIIRSWFPNDMPFALLCVKPLRFQLGKIDSSDIMISLSDKQMGKRYADFEKKYKQLQLICNTLQRTYSIRIPQEKYQRYCDENIPDVLQNLISDTVPFCQLARGCSMVVTDRENDAIDTLQLGRRCILISNEISKFMRYKQNYGDCLILAGSWAEALEALKSIDGLQSEELSVTEPTQIIDKLIDIYHNREEKKRAVINATLLMISIKLVPEIWKLLGNCKTEHPIEPLLMEFGRVPLWSDEIFLPNSIRMFRRNGYKAVNKIIENKEYYKKETTRMIGLNKYADVMFVGEPSDFEKKLIGTVESSQKQIVSEREFLKIIIKSLDNPIIKEELSPEKLLPEVMFRGTAYYRLGEFDNALLLLKKKQPVKNPILAFIYDDADMEQCLKLRRNGSDRTIFLLDYRDKKEKQKTDDDSIYVVSEKILPTRLLRLCQTIAFCRDATINCIMADLGKEVISDSMSSEAEAISLSGNCEFLSADSLDKIYSYKEND